MKRIDIALLGMGTVGTGVVKLLEGNATDIEKKAGIPVAIKKILVRDPAKYRNTATKAEITTELSSIIDDPDIQIVVEVMGGETPAKDYIIQALNAGKHVVTANKDVIAKYGRELFAAAEKNHVDLLFEASVGGGIPIIRPLKQCLAANRIQQIMGIVNGTTNYMLTKMSKERMDFGEVLEEAQKKGYAEANPIADIGGWDAARKIAILASIAFNTRVTLDDVYVEGITDLSLQDIDYASELGYVVKLVAIAKEENHEVTVRVHPAFIPINHPLASVNDVFNAIFITGDAVGETMFYGRGAGELPTASAVCADVIDVARDIRHGVSSRILCTCFEDKKIASIDSTQTPYYLRLLVEDKPGVFAAIASAFGTQQVSLNSVIQKRKVAGCAEIVLITYKVSHANLRSAVTTLATMPSVKHICSIIRVEAE